MAYYIGIMSGTSLDGVDLALVDINQHRIELLDCCALAMPHSLRQSLLSLSQDQTCQLLLLGEVEQQLSQLYAQGVKQLLAKATISSSEVVAIGCHGQTVFHAPKATHPFTMQLLDGNLLAAKTGITTIGDFRRMDMAFGGQGAPLVPAFHQQLFADYNSTSVVVNIGGIANISVLAVDGSCLGYDTGVGNMLLDAWCSQHTGQAFDDAGRWAATGRPIPELLQRLLAEPYLHLPPPKSTGRELFNLAWLEALLTGYSTVLAEDVQATLQAFTVASIADEVSKFAQGERPRLIVCGGGVHNAGLMAGLQSSLPQWLVASSAEWGVDPDHMEAMAFAWLAQRRSVNLPSNLPAVTGASKAVSLGVIYPAP